MVAMVTMHISLLQMKLIIYTNRKNWVLITRMVELYSIIYRSFLSVNLNFYLIFDHLAILIHDSLFELCTGLWGGFLSPRLNRT